MKYAGLLVLLGVCVVGNLAGACVISGKWVGQTVFVEGWQLDPGFTWTYIDLVIMREADHVYYDLSYYRGREDEVGDVISLHTGGEFETGAFWSQPNANLKHMRLKTVISATNNVNGETVQIPIDLQLRGREQPVRAKFHNFLDDEDYILITARNTEQTNGNVANGFIGDFIFTEDGCPTPPCPQWDYHIEMSAGVDHIVLKVPDDSFLCLKKE